MIATETVNPFVYDWRARHIRWGCSPKGQCPQQQVRLGGSLVLR